MQGVYLAVCTLHTSTSKGSHPNEKARYKMDINQNTTRISGTDGQHQQTEIRA